MASPRNESLSIDHVLSASFHPWACPRCSPEAIEVQTAKGKGECLPVPHGRQLATRTFSSSLRSCSTPAKCRLAHLLMVGVRCFHSRSAELEPCCSLLSVLLFTNSCNCFFSVRNEMPGQDVGVCSLSCRRFLRRDRCGDDGGIQHEC
jgi:hypothetical protein